jgi:hypothetical protein
MDTLEVGLAIMGLRQQQCVADEFHPQLSDGSPGDCSGF